VLAAGRASEQTTCAGPRCGSCYDRRVDSRPLKTPAEFQSIADRAERSRAILGLDRQRGGVPVIGEAVAEPAILLNVRLANVHVGAIQQVIGPR
jgi:hypothetical protein